MTLSFRERPGIIVIPILEHFRKNLVLFSCGQTEVIKIPKHMLQYLSFKHSKMDLIFNFNFDKMNATFSNFFRKNKINHISDLFGIIYEYIQTPYKHQNHRITSIYEARVYPDMFKLKVNISQNNDNDNVKITLFCLENQVWVIQEFQKCFAFSKKYVCKECLTYIKSSELIKFSQREVFNEFLISRYFPDYYCFQKGKQITPIVQWSDDIIIVPEFRSASMYAKLLLFNKGLSLDICSLIFSYVGNPVKFYFSPPPIFQCAKCVSKKIACGKYWIYYKQPEWCHYFKLTPHNIYKNEKFGKDQPIYLTHQQIQQILSEVNLKI